MVKIPDLSNKQLLSQLEKYEKIMDQLVKERDKRVAANPTDDLYTKKELIDREVAKKMAAQQAQMAAAAPAAAQAAAAAPAEAPKGKEDNFLSFDEDELSAIEAATEEDKAKDPEEDEEVRVTQLLQLSKEDLAALQANKKKIQKKG
jgi:hypothetical protein